MIEIIEYFVMSRFSLKIGLFIATALFVSATLAVPLNNGPYAPGQQPPTATMRKLSFVKTSDSTGSFTGDQGTSIHLSVATNGISVCLVDDEDQVVFPLTQISGEGMLQFVEAWRVDLNHDGHPDFLILYPTGGCGINADLSYVVILLSDAAGYRETTTASWFQPEDLILINGEPRLIHSTLFDQRGGFEDGRTHSFWVYNLLGFSGGEAHIDNSGAADFPKVVWYSSQPNYQETGELSSDQKERFIRRSQAVWRE